MHRVLLLEDDAALSRNLARYLGRDGCEVKAVYDLAKARDALRTDPPPSLVILDLALPDGNGLEFLDDFRSVHAEIPVIITTGSGADEDELTGFHAGANDFVRKPYSLPILAARVRAWLNAHSTLSLAAMTFNPRNGVLDAGSGNVSLTSVQARVLLRLADRPNEKVTRDQLRESWPVSSRPARRTVDHHVWAIRMRLKAIGAEKFLKSVRGGYVWSGPPITNNSDVGHSQSEAI